MKVSVVIRTLNEERHLPALLSSIASQNLEGHRPEIVLVDSGSTDRTVEIAKSFDATITSIKKDEFTFGRALNVGCAAASGEVLVFVSGHCIPASDRWIELLTAPLVNGRAAYSYGRQIGDESSRYSERQLFRKYFPPVSQVPQQGFFCNNANSALLRSAWETHRFDEELTGLEDMELGARLVRDGQMLAYVAEAAVYHLHDESWRKIKTRYEREAIALQKIMPQVHVSFWDFVRYFASAVLLDSGQALQEKEFLQRAHEIVAFRLMQFWGTFCGNNEHRKLSHQMKEKYFYPR